MPKATKDEPKLKGQHLKLTPEEKLQNYLKRHGPVEKMSVAQRRRLRKRYMKAQGRTTGHEH